MNEEIELTDNYFLHETGYTYDQLQEHADFDNEFDSSTILNEIEMTHGEQSFLLSLSEYAEMYENFRDSLFLSFFGGEL